MPVFVLFQKDVGTGEVRPSWIRRLQQQQEGSKATKGTEAKQESKEKGRQEAKKTASGNIGKKRPTSTIGEGVKKQPIAKEQVEKSDRVVEKMADGKGPFRSYEFCVFEGY